MLLKCLWIVDYGFFIVYCFIETDNPLNIKNPRAILKPIIKLEIICSFAKLINADINETKIMKRVIFKIENGCANKAFFKNKTEKKKIKIVKLPTKAFENINPTSFCSFCFKSSKEVKLSLLFESVFILLSILVNDVTHDAVEF